MSALRYRMALFFRSLLCLGVAGVCLCVSTSVNALDLPPAPADGVLDNTRALSAEVRQELAKDIAAYRTATGIETWVHAGTFLRYGETIQLQARLLRRQWSPKAEAVLLNYDRATEAYHITLSPGLWSRYPTAEILSLQQRTHDIMSDKAQPLETRLLQTFRLILTEVKRLENRYHTMSETLSAPHQRLGMVFAGVLAAGTLLTVLLVRATRRREADAAWQLFFPSVQVAFRFGAPHGGGVTVEKTARANEAV